MAEVAEHVTEQSAWFVHEGSVYDATPFLEDHPGGEKGQKIRILLSHLVTLSSGARLTLPISQVRIPSSLSPAWMLQRTSMPSILPRQRRC